MEATQKMCCILERLNNILIAVSNHHSNVYFRLSCFCVYDVKVGHSCIQSCPSCSILRRRSHEFSQSGTTFSDYSDTTWMRFNPAHYLYWTVSECIMNIREEEETLILSDFSSLFVACIWATWIWNTNTQKNVAKFMSMMCFSEKETKDLIAILTEPHEVAVEDLDGFLSQGRFPTETHEVLLSSEPSLVRWHLLSFPARTVGHTSLTAPFWKTGSPHYVRAFISGTQVSFARLRRAQLFPVHQ